MNEGDTVEPGADRPIARSVLGWINDLLASIDWGVLIPSAVCIALVFLLRKLLARWIVGAIQALLNQFRVTLSEEVVSQLRIAAQILSVAATLFFVLQVFQPPALADGFLRRILASVAIIVIFGSWYQMGGSFAAMLRSQKQSSLKLEVDWVQRVTQFAILLLGVTALLNVWEVNIGGVLTGVGVLGAGLAIATQDLIRNLVAGMTNISEKRFETGDIIQIDGKFSGTVKRIDLRSTQVVGFDQIPRHIPNSELSDSIVLNYSTLKHRRIMLRIGLILASTEDQIKAVRDGLIAYHQTCGDFDLSEDAPKYMYVGEIGPSAVDVFLYVRTGGPGYKESLEIMERLSLAILRIVKEAGTDLAYPTQTIKLDADGLAPASDPVRSAPPS